MSNMAEFDSRTARIGFGREKVYNFITDIRNFERFIPPGTISSFKTDKDSGTFQAGMIGSVNIRISEKSPYSNVVYSGNALGDNDFLLILDIDNVGIDKCAVKVKLQTDMNPMFRMVASEPIRKFMETLIAEMEKFHDWEKTK